MDDSYIDGVEDDRKYEEVNSDFDQKYPYGSNSSNEYTAIVYDI